MEVSPVDQFMIGKRAASHGSVGEEWLMAETW